MAGLLHPDLTTDLMQPGLDTNTLRTVIYGDRLHLRAIVRRRGTSSVDRHPAKVPYISKTRCQWCGWNDVGAHDQL